MLVHCGGPGSDKSCALDIATSYPEIAAEFDIWAIDQRGVGDSVPSLGCPASSWKALPAANQSIGAVGVSDFTTCECAMADGTPQANQCYADLDPDNSTQASHL